MKTKKQFWLRLLVPLSFILVAFCWPATLTAQTFVKSYGSPDGREEGSCLLPLKGGDSLIVAGFKNDSTLLMIVDADGNLLLKRTFKFSQAGNSDRIADIGIDSEGHLYGAGLGVNNIVANYTGFAFRYSIASDLLIWSHEWGNSSDAWSILEIFPNRYKIFGEERLGPIGGNTEDAFAADVNAANGNMSNGRQFNLAGSETFQSTILFGNDLYACGRFTFNGNVNGMRPTLTRMNASHNLVTATSCFVPINLNARIYASDLTLSGNEIVMASSGDFNGATTNTTFLALSSHDLNTNVNWGRVYDFPSSGNESALEVVRGIDELHTLGSFRDQNGTIFLLNTDLSGSLLGATSYQDYIRVSNEPGDGRLVAANGSLYFTGSTPLNAEGTQDLVLMRVNTDGTIGTDCPVVFHEPQVTVNNLGFPNPVVEDPSTLGANLTTIPSFDPPMTTEVNCGSDCFAKTDTLYTTIPNSIVLTGQHAFPAKVYVPAGVIITIDGPNSVLDLTNTDIVFEDCAGINVTDGASVRANNSVFRTCDPSLSWRGFYFNGASESMFNECTFKNAQKAIDILGSVVNPGSLSCRITNNLFANNRYAIEVNNMAMEEAISGNTFLVDGASIDYSPVDCPVSLPYLNDHFGIRAMNTDFRATISQNDFINAKPEGAAQDLYGIYASICSGRASRNQFTNAFRGVELNNASLFSLENNILETTQGTTDLQSQIRVSGASSWIWITGNDLINSNENQQMTFNNSAVYVDNSSTVNIKENYIEGFPVGIQAENLRLCQIGENQISNAGTYGVYVRNGLRNTVSCNEINMRRTPGVFSCGIGYFVQNPATTSIDLRSNCIFNGVYGMFTSAGQAGSLPPIHNNYFYNYSAVGIYNTGFTGSIGSAIFPVTSAGRNTFVSNNLASVGSPSSYDIYSVPNISAIGNQGILNVNANVFTNGNGVYNSTAACGNQSGPLNTELLDEDLCDNYTDNMDGTFRLLAQGDWEAAKELQHAQGDDALLLADAWMQKLWVEGETHAAELFLQHILSGEQLNQDQTNRLTYNHLIRKGDWQGATAALGNSTEDWSSLSRIASSMHGSLSLTAAEASILDRLQTDEGMIGDIARDWLHIARQRADYRYAPVIVPDLKTDGQMVSLQTSTFSVYPNPSTGSLQLQYNLMELGGGKVEIYDSQGRLIFRESLELQSQLKRYDFSGLGQGVYLIAVSDQNGLVGTKNWLKLK